MKMEPEMIDLLNNLLRKGVLRTSTFLDAFLANDRKDFVPEEYYE